MKSSDIKNTLRDEDADVFNWRELKALEAMDSCHYEYELQGQIGRGVGRGTLQELVRRGLAKQGPSPRQRGEVGYAITDAGRAALHKRLLRRN
ncbi:MAG: hypothetical protein ACLPV2_09905 [Steroidobacteraceae bacterium]